ncbi:MAG TPA: YlxR family protein [Firmicutes bacterium]|nr:YlxR family protein [Bacillota bacterium]
MPKAKKQPRVRKVPQRTCVGCRSVRPKRELIRVVRTPGGDLVLDPTGKLSGRGAYLCPDTTCLRSALAKGGIASALGTSPSEELISRLEEELRRRQIAAVQQERKTAGGGSVDGENSSL